MYASLFRAAAQSISGQRSWRVLVSAHLIIVGFCFWIIQSNPKGEAYLAGAVLLIAGIIEGALLIGWRLTQLPKSLAIEFLFVTPLRPHGIFFSETAIGAARLAMITFAGLPVFAFLHLDGNLFAGELLLVMVMPLSWGMVAGVALTAWAYESRRRRRFGEKIFFLLVLAYLVVGVFAGEKLNDWLGFLTPGVRLLIVGSISAFHTFNPFAVMKYGYQQSVFASDGRVLWLQFAAMAAVMLGVFRAMFRFRHHFHDLHFRAVEANLDKTRKPVSVNPLAWWAVKRVSEYSGRVNLWLAAGFGVLYAIHLLAGPHWPVWMGRGVFQAFDAWFGIAGLTAGLVVMSAVPAAFQYGLWDSNVQDRCKKLELLLLTRLCANDYWMAALQAAWIRGRGYLFVAILIWIAGAFGGRLSPAHALLALTTSGLMWLLYFSLGFRAFTKGMQANNLGMALTVGLPLAACALFKANLAWLAALTPPGMVYQSAASGNAIFCLTGAFLTGLIILFIHRVAVRDCLAELKGWYEKHHGAKAIR